MKAWGGRFSKDTSKLMEDMHSSISFDQRLHYWDIQGSIAHAKMLAHTAIISQSEAKEICGCLEQILLDIESGKVEFDVSAEDIHMNIEQLLTSRIGSVGKKLHTGRSRNDQVALDMRLFLRAEVQNIQESLKKLLSALVALAEEHVNTIMPGYTHLQRAQPITLAHHLLAYFEMFWRDGERLVDCNKRINICPLGASALAGTSFPLDRQFVADELGFSSVSNNSVDAVSDRDFVIEFLAASSIMMMHFSRLCEELVLWSSQEYSFVEFDDAFSTGSSIMPQKKNPDAAELIRGKTGRVYGALLTLLTVMKGLPLAYNKDMQEDKEPLFDTVDTLKKCLVVLVPALTTLKVNAANMKSAAKGGFGNATDVADYLVAKGIPFRDAHEIVGKLVSYCLTKSKNLEDLSIKEFNNFSALFAEDLYPTIDIEACVAKRNIVGGPAPQQTTKAIAKAKERLAQLG